MLAWMEHKTREVKDKQAEKLQLEIQVVRMDSQSRGVASKSVLNENFKDLPLPSLKSCSILVASFPSHLTDSDEEQA